MKKLLLALALLAGVSPAKALDAEMILGVANTFYTAYNGFVGSTTVTPAFALGYWRVTDYGTLPSGTYKYDWMIVRDKVTDTFSYTYTSNQTPGNTGVTNHNAFSISSKPARRNYRCDSSLSPTQPTVDNLLETFSIDIWAKSIVKTGWFPPSGPFPVWLKTTYTTLANSCAAISPVSSIIRNGCSVDGNGGTFSVTFAIVDAEYNWPPLCWVGNAYDY